MVLWGGVPELRARFWLDTAWSLRSGSDWKDVALSGVSLG